MSDEPICLYVDEVAGEIIRPCPFCGGEFMIQGSWYVNDEEVDAFECIKCKAGAPASVWNQRKQGNQS